MAEKYTLNAWKRPISRTYEINMQLGENYYSPQTSYLDHKSGILGGRVTEAPGALTMR